MDKWCQEPKFLTHKNKGWHKNPKIRLPKFVNSRTFPLRFSPLFYFALWRCGRCAGRSLLEAAVALCGASCAVVRVVCLQAVLCPLWPLCVALEAVPCAMRTNKIYSC